MVSLLWLVTILLVVLWVLGYAVNIGAWINFLLVAAIIILLVNAISMFMARHPVTHVHEDHVHEHDVHHDEL